MVTTLSYLMESLENFLGNILRFISFVQFQKPDSWSIGLSENVYRPTHTVSHRYHAFKCYSSVTSGQPFGQHGFNTAAMVLKR